MDREEADRREAGREGVNGPAPADAVRPVPASAIRLDAVVRRQGTFTAFAAKSTEVTGE